MQPRCIGASRPCATYTKNAVFAVTRWSNIYFPVRFGLFGDFVGGSLRDKFGEGIWDIPVRHSSFWRTWTPKAHVSYWDEPTSLATASLRQVLEFEAVFALYKPHRHAQVLFVISLSVILKDEPAEKIWIEARAACVQRFTCTNTLRSGRFGIGPVSCRLTLQP